MTAAPTPDPDDDALAAEYVLHLLPPDRRAAVEDRLAVEGGLRARVAFWADALAGLADEVAEVPPPADLARRIEAALGAALAPPPAARAAPRRRFTLLGLLGGGALAVAATLAVVGLLPWDWQRGDPFAPGYVAEMAAPENALVIVAAYDPDLGELRLSRSTGQAPAGRVLELWVIAPGAATPVSLGVLPEGPETVVRVPEALRPAMTGATLAVSEEPPGGSPLAGPSGAVLAASPLVPA